MSDIMQRLREAGFEERLASNYDYVSFAAPNAPKGATIYVHQSNSHFHVPTRLGLAKYPNNTKLREYVKGRGKLVNNGKDFRLEAKHVDEVISIMYPNCAVGVQNRLPRLPDDESMPSSRSNARQQTLNTILYGPPGTGKTYKTARRCVEICDEVGKDEDDDEIRSRYRELVNEQRVEFVTFHQSYGYEEFVEGLRPAAAKDGAGFRLKVRRGVLRRIAHRARKHPESAYVLVIDEINRANISKVMGELITLLEEDKREGAENAIAVTLPHSGKRFTLPPNLHILGTMNTADRSIALIDTALRRRFEFDEMAPEPSKLPQDVAGIKLQDVLTTINERLEYLIDRDHLIGHAWLMKVEAKSDVDRVMRRKIIPLIAEYFYDDWRKVRAVLGNTDDFVRREHLSAPPGFDDLDADERFRWTIRDRFEDGAYARLVGGQASASDADAGSVS